MIACKSRFTPTALVTGASSGIGEEYARQLASRGYDLILVAKPEDEGLLERICRELSQSCGVFCENLAVELSNYRDVTRIVEKIEATPSLTFLVNNAGFSNSGIFHQMDVKKHLDMINVHDVACVRFTHAALPVLLNNAKKAAASTDNTGCSIVNVSSVCIFMICDSTLVYRASKMFIKCFTESLAYLVRNTAIKVQVLCPGFTRTNYHVKMGMSYDDPFFKKYKLLTPKEVVDCSFRQLGKNKVVCIPSWYYRVFAFLVRALPRKVFFKIYEKSKPLAPGNSNPPGVQQ